MRTVRLIVTEKSDFKEKVYAVTDGQTDGQTDRQTDGQTDDEVVTIPIGKICRGVTLNN